MNIIEKYFNKDWRLVGFYFEGVPYIYQDDDPLGTTFLCYENQFSDRKVIEKGHRVRRSNHRTRLKYWRKKKLIIMDMPSYKDIVSGKKMYNYDRAGDFFRYPHACVRTYRDGGDYPQSLLGHPRRIK